MKKHHYVYSSYEEWGREYIGVRSCDCMPEEDTKYFGSFRDKTFKPTGKNILFVCRTRKEAAEIEIILHDFFDVAVNSKFANRSKAVSTGFSTAGVPKTEEQKKAHSERMSGKALTEEHKRKLSEANTGENNPNYGVPNSEAQKKAHSERMSGRYIGALNPSSKAVIAIEPDGAERHFGGRNQAARELEINRGDLSRYLKTGHSPKWGKWKGWRFIYKNSTNF